MSVFYLILVLTPFDQPLSSLAYAEMRLILARMIWNFDMELAPESQGWIDQLSFVVWEKPGLKVRLTPASYTKC